MENPEITLTLFVACYNEEANITNAMDTAIEACQEAGVSFELVVIDDASKDRSVEIITNYIKAHPDVPIHLHVNERNQGLGANYAEAAFIGKGTWYRLHCGDDVEPKETLVKIFKEIGKAEVLIPYRPDDVKGRPLSRKIISRTFTALINFISGHKLHYYNGMPLTRRYYIMRWHSNSHGFGFQADLITRLLDRDISYLEIPVTGHERGGGNSNALKFRNFCSVSNTLLTIIIRRIAKILYGYN
jgi:glycosyltransferase involved in cell wall biosynthesis